MRVTVPIQILHRGLATLLALFCLAAGPAIPDLLVPQLRVSQVHQLQGIDEVALRAYLDLGEPGDLPSISAENLRASLGERNLRLDRLDPMRGSGEGVAYIFLVDVSRSLSRTEFDRIVEQIESWTARLPATDRAAILTFGEQVRLVADFTADRRMLAAALSSLGPTDELTLFYRALDEALDLAERRDPELPGRRALVVLTDGRDEGSGLTADDILARLRTNPAPIYAIGHSRLREPLRRQYLDVLHRLATNSGGAFFEAGRTDFAAAYREIRNAVLRVWLADFACPECPADGRDYRFQAVLRVGGRILTDGQGVRIFPPQKQLATTVFPPPGSPPPSVTQAPEPTRGEPIGAPALRLSLPWWKRALIVVGVLVALLLALIVRRLIRGPESARLAYGHEPPEPEPYAPLDPELPAREFGAQSSPPPSALAPDLDAPAGPMRALRLIVVRGSKPGREYRFILEDRAVIGSRSSCDCVLAGEPNVEPEQFELQQRGGRVFAYNRAEQRPTLLDGFPLEHHTPIDSDDLIGNGDLILRIVFD